jgi:hypothetical protein
MAMIEQRFRRGALALACAGALFGCSTSTRGVQGRFVAVQNTLAALGGTQLGRLTEGSLGEGGTVRVPVELEARCYLFQAFGSDGVRNLDLSVVDSRDQAAAADNTTDPSAIVRYCAPSRGRYVLALRATEGSGAYLLGSWAVGASSGGDSAAAGPGTCDNPIPVRPGETVTGTTRGAPSQHTGRCLGGGGGGEGDDEDGPQQGRGAPERVYALTLERRQLVTVAVEQGGGYDGAVYLRAGACADPGAEPENACNDDAPDTSHSLITVPLDAGTHYIFVDGFGSSRGTYSMTVTARDVPDVNEVCRNAAALTPNTPVTGQLTAQDLNLFQARCGAQARGPERVYRLEVPQESRLQLHQESDYDGLLHVRSACADASREVACNDDAEDISHSRINTVLPAGTYYVFSDGYAPNAAGNYTLQADLAPVAGGNTPGDTCLDAIPITPGTPVEGNTFMAHDDLRPSCAAQTDGYDVVYRLNVTSRSRVRLWIDQSDLLERGSGDQFTLTVTRDCAQVSAASCQANVFGQNRAYDQILDAGQYYVVVDSAAPRRFGRFRLNAQLDDPQALERACRAAPLLVPGRQVSGTTSGNDRFQAGCAGGARSAETLYRLVVRQRSNVRLALSTPNHDGALFLRANCLDAATERACNDDAGDTRHSLIETQLEPGTYTVFVDGFSQNNAGPFTLDVQVTPAAGGAGNRPITPVRPGAAPRP